MSIYEELKRANVPLDNYCSDLYALVCSESTAIIEKYKFKSNVTKFISDIDHKAWYDIPFAYDPHYDNRS